MDELCDVLSYTCTCMDELCTICVICTHHLQYKRLPSIKKRLMAIYRVLAQHRDTDGRVVTELFVKRPSPKMYPEYYTIIKRPIDLKEIYQKIRELQVCCVRARCC